ncbi:hypothetical protein PG995_006230 [Apiospora arundinis]|uniref:Imidazoleglycerol-phosphate dehydratase n=1 Tax=Apiospora arundinis TaxID=335852 RepID=A0ABR2I8N9_9PEZI
MKPHDALNASDVTEAQWEATRGAAIGAAKWGAASAILGAAAYAFSPIYRGLTIQFKVYIQMSGMIVGSMIEADSHMRLYEHRVRMQRQFARDRAKWEALEREFAEDQGGPPPPPRPKHLREAEEELKRK